MVRDGGFYALTQGLPYGTLPDCTVVYDGFLKDAGGWHKQVADQGGLRGYFSALALDQEDQAWIGY